MRFNSKGSIIHNDTFFLSTKSAGEVSEGSCDTDNLSDD